MSFAKITLPELRDPRGNLVFAEEQRHVPFAVKRMFAIYGVPPGVARGGHAHRAQQQLLLMLAGECTVVVDDGLCRVEERLETPTAALHVPAGLWLELKDFSSGAICLVLASGPYDEGDYIRDYSEFRAET
jgi:dTDP-4-dehydrorhamnose 3,5-epimerase-like enzyme